MFLEIVERVIKERDTLWQERDTLQQRLEELGNDLWDALKKERQLLRREVMFLEDT